MRAEKSEEIPAALIEQFSAYLDRNLGLYYPKKAWWQVEKKIPEIARSFGFRDPSGWVKWLLDQPVSSERIANIAQHLTIGETYFFRDPASLDYLKTNVLAPLIEERQKTTRYLKVWSSACCTGEEPYSLAIIIDELLPAAYGWDLSIIGTDINPEFLRRAKAGNYRDWSFRSSCDELKRRYFTVHNGLYQIASKIQQNVNFGYLNLVEDKYPSLMNGTAGNDLILCNNVLIYFSEGQIKHVINQLTQCLADGGYLCVSPVEAPLVSNPLLKPVSSKRANIFQKCSQSSYTVKKTEVSGPAFRKRAEVHLPKGTAVKKEEASEDTGALKVSNDQKLLSSGLQAYESGDYRASLEILSPILLAIKPKQILTEQTLKAIKIAIRASANLGELETSLSWCLTSLSLEKTDPILHYLHAALLQELGRPYEAAYALRSAIFLDSEFTIAYFTLGNILLKLDDVMQAKKQLNNALATMKKYGSDELLHEGEGLTVERMRMIIQNMLERL